MRLRASDGQFPEVRAILNLRTNTTILFIP
jgi:hypothetical protein